MEHSRMLDTHMEPASLVWRRWPAHRVSTGTAEDVLSVARQSPRLFLGQTMLAVWKDIGATSPVEFQVAKKKRNRCRSPGSWEPGAPTKPHLTRWPRAAQMEQSLPRGPSGSQQGYSKLPFTMLNLSRGRGHGETLRRNRCYVQSWVSGLLCGRASQHGILLFGFNEGKWAS